MLATILELLPGAKSEVQYHILQDLAGMLTGPSSVTHANRRMLWQQPGWERWLLALAVPNLNEPWQVSDAHGIINPALESRSTAATSSGSEDSIDLKISSDADVLCDPYKPLLIRLKALGRLHQVLENRQGSSRALIAQSLIVVLQRPLAPMKLRESVTIVMKERLPEYVDFIVREYAVEFVVAIIAERIHDPLGWRALDVAKECLNAANGGGHVLCSLLFYVMARIERKLLHMEQSGWKDTLWENIVVTVSISTDIVLESGLSAASQRTASKNDPPAWDKETSDKSYELTMLLLRVWGLVVPHVSSPTGKGVDVSARPPHPAALCGAPSYSA